jgi:uncharacterized lipoprotein YddW (UPF0748 family)
MLFVMGMLTTSMLATVWTRGVHAADCVPILYNNDTSCMYYQGTATPNTVRAFVDKVAGTQVDTYLICAACMVSNFPSTTVEWLGDGRTPPPYESPTTIKMAQNIGNLVAQGYDPLGLAIDEAKQKGMKAFLTYRMNDVHATDQADSLLFSSFWKNHPEYRVGTGSYSDAALNYALPQVRQHYLDRIQEVVDRYGDQMDGLELDWQRFPSYFTSSMPGFMRRYYLSQFVTDVRQITNQYSQEHGRDLQLTARVLPTIEQSREIGLDPVAWAGADLVDSITVSRFLYNNDPSQDDPMDIKGYKREISNIPIYASIEAMDSPEYPGMTYDMYRSEAEALRDAGADGIYLFNMCYGQDDPGNIALLHELGGSPTPEPSCLTLLFSGTVALAAMFWFRIKGKRSWFRRSLSCLSVYAALGTVGQAADAAGPPSAEVPRPSIHGVLYNEDDSNRFVLDPTGQMKPERLDRMVDDLADSQVAVMLICCCAQKTNYPSKVWDIHCDGFDPNKDNNQAFFGDTPQGSRPEARQWAQNLQLMLNSGVDPMQRMTDRCRKRGISPWGSIRMNDVHEAHLLKSPLHSRFWMDHPEYWRFPDRSESWLDRCLNYRIEPVRDHMMALIREVCDRYDLDGLELDWNRFARYFREGEEVEGGKELTAWMADVRKAVRAAEKKWKHPIWLAARVPARPEVSMGIGLDAVAWAKRGLIDHLIVAPFFHTIDYDIPVDKWNKLLRGTGVGVTVCLEALIQSYPDAPRLTGTTERYRGAAMAALGRGSQGIYVFNWFGIPSTEAYLLREMQSMDSLADKDRSYLVTYTDIEMPAKPIPAALPKKLAPHESAGFSLYIGPKPLPSARCIVQLTLKSERPEKNCLTNVTLNGRPPIGAGSFAFGPEALRDGYNTIRVANAGNSAIRIECVELSLQFPSKGKK